MTRLAHLWYQSRCTACGACIAACNAANYHSTDITNKAWGWLASNIRRVEILRGHRPLLYLIQCQHREAAPCVTVCLTGGSYKDVDGLVKIKPELCIGCKYCMVACIYNARWLDEETGQPRKCMEDECLSQVKAGLDPVCVAVCPAKARAFGDVDDPHSKISRRLAKSRYVRLLENKGTEPKYFVVVGP